MAPARILPFPSGIREPTSSSNASASGVGFDELAETVADVQAVLGTNLTRLEDRCFLIDGLGNARRERLGVPAGDQATAQDPLCGLIPAYGRPGWALSRNSLRRSSHIHAIFPRQSRTSLDCLLTWRYFGTSTTCTPFSTLFNCPWGHPASEATARPISAERIGRCKTDLTAEQTAEFESIAGPELERLGYL